jgi:hypothetical protein
MAQTKIVGTSMIIYFSGLHLSKCKGSWVVSIKQNMYFNFQQSSTLASLVFTKTVLLKLVYPLKIYQHIQFHSSTVFCIYGWLRFSPGKGSRHPLDRRLGGPQNWSGHRAERKNHLPLPEMKPQSSSLLSDTTLIELSYSNYDLLKSVKNLWKSRYF